MEEFRSPVKLSSPGEIHERVMVPLEFPIRAERLVIAAGAVESDEVVVVEAVTVID